RRDRRLAGGDEKLGVLGLELRRVGGAASLDQLFPRGCELGLPFDRRRLQELRDQLRIRRGVEQPRDQAVEVRSRGVFGVDHFLKSKIVLSVLVSIMSTTRQSPHICRRRVPPANIEWPDSLPSMLSTIWRVPNGLPQRTQLKGSASFSVTASFASFPNSNLGMRAMACSGHVFTQRPHCTQLRSMKRNAGVSVASMSADSGHAPTHALHSVQVCWFTASAPKGAPAGSGMVFGSWRARWSRAKSRVVRFSGERLKLAGFATVAAGCSSHRSAGFSSSEKCFPA